MKTLTVLAAMASLAIAGPALAQMSSQQVMPNGNVRTTTTSDTPMGTHSTTRVDRPDGSTRVMERDSNGMGSMRDNRDMRDNREMRDNRDMRDHHGRGGWNHGRHRVCETHWRHHQRVRRCWMR